MRIKKMEIEIKSLRKDKEFTQTTIEEYKRKNKQLQEQLDAKDAEYSQQMEKTNLDLEFANNRINALQE